MDMHGFEISRRLEKLELDIMNAVRRVAPFTVRAFPVSIQQWGVDKLEVNGIYATNLGEFFLVDFGGKSGLIVQALDTRRALDLVDMMEKMGVVGNLSSLSELVYDDPTAHSRLTGLPPAEKPLWPD